MPPCGDAVVSFSPNTYLCIVHDHTLDTAAHATYITVHVACHCTWPFRQATPTHRAPRSTAPG